MQLPHADSDHLERKGFCWQLHTAANTTYLVLSSVQIDASLYDHSEIDLMIRIPAGYPLAKLDMFYVSPTIRLNASNNFPKAASHFEDHLGRKWQRFSRHLQKWEPGSDSLASFLALILAELRNGGD